MSSAPRKKVKDRTVVAEAKRVKGTALPWFISSRLTKAKQDGLSVIEQGCLALEKEGMPCPMDVSGENWIRTNFSYICAKYKEAYPNPISYSKPAKAKRKSKPAARSELKPKPIKVAGVDVTSDAFLSTYEWRKVRMQTLKKYGPRCQCCGATPSDGAVMNVDHIKPRKLRPDLALDVNNTQILCNECNHGKGNWDQTDWRPA